MSMLGMSFRSILLLDHRHHTLLEGATQLTMADVQGTRGTYQTYKEDTNAFLTWLAQTAESRGQQHDSESNTDTTSKPRLKGRARKAAREAAAKKLDDSVESRRLSLEDFTACAKTISEARDPVVTISPSILAVAHRALALRKRCANWFASQKNLSHETLEGNWKHQYFNHWLEDLLSILKPCGNAFTAEKEEPAEEFDFNNRFASLEVEEPSLDWAAFETATKNQTLPTAASKQGKDLAYTMQDPDEEKYLAIFCLYEDLNRLRRRICEMWTEYRLGKADLVSVSLGTNIALEHGTYLERQFLEFYPDLNTSHKIMIALLRILESADVGPSNLSVVIEEINHVGISQLLMEWIIMPTMTTCRDVWGAGETVLMDYGIANRQPWPSSRPESDDDLLHRIRTSTNSLCSVVSELTIWRDCQVKIPMQDLFTQSILVVEPAEDRPLSTAFATRAFLDIHEIMGADIDYGFKELNRFRDSLDQSFQLSKFEPTIATAVAGVKKWLDTDHGHLMKDALLRAWSPEEAARVEADRDRNPPAPAFKLFKQHPLLCGMLLFHFQILIQWGVQQDANERASILSNAHLYNALQKTKLLSRRWEDLDHILASHNQNEFFLGGPPEHATGFARQWALVNGVRATFFSSENMRRIRRDPGSMNRSLKAHKQNKVRALVTPTPLAGTFSNHYLDCTGTSKNFGVMKPEVSLAIADHVRRILATRITDPQLSLLQSNLASMHPEHQVQQLYAIFRNFEAKALAFNYARMHQRCFLVLQSLKDLMPEIEEFARNHPGFNDTNAFFIVWTLYMREEEAMMETGTRPNIANAPTISKTFKDVAQKMDALIEEEGGFEMKIVNNTHGYVGVQFSLMISANKSSSWIAPRDIHVPQPRCVVLSEMKTIPDSLSGLVLLKDSYVYNALVET